jgi:hypothetical protein
MQIRVVAIAILNSFPGNISLLLTAHKIHPVRSYIIYIHKNQVRHGIVIE